MHNDIKVGDSVTVYEREQFEHRGENMGNLMEAPRDFEIVGIVDKENGIIVVDDERGQRLRLAQWFGSDDQCFRF
jgi:hypothetical protein